MPRPASTFRSATSPLRRLVAAGAVGLACGLGATPAAAVIILGSSAGNTSSPTDPGLATRWGQVGNFSSSMALADAEKIAGRALQVVPSLAHAELLDHWVGLRPGR